MTPSRPWMPVFSKFAPAVFAATVVISAGNAFAQFGRYGGYQMLQRQMQAAQKQSQAAQQQQKEEYDAFMKRFDTNKNGKIDGKEKGPAKKYMRELQMGIDPDKAIKTLGTSSSTRTKRSSTK